MWCTGKSLGMPAFDELRAAWTKFRSADPLTDNDLVVLIEAIDAALPLLDSMPEAGAVRRVLLMERDSLVGYQRARKVL